MTDDILTVRVVCWEHGLADEGDVECDGCEERADFHRKVAGSPIEGGGRWWQATPRKTLVHHCYGGEEVVLRRQGFMRTETLMGDPALSMEDDPLLVHEYRWWSEAFGVR